MSQCKDGFIARYIGIDGGTQTGLAIYRPHIDKFFPEKWELQTTDFWGAYECVLDLSPTTTRIVVEDPSQVSTIFHNRAVTRGGRDKTAQRVGAVKRESLLLIEGLRRKGYDVVGAYITNARGFLGSKLSAKQFANITGYTGRSSQHARDAGRILMYAYPEIVPRIVPKRR